MAATSKDGPELHSATVELARGRNYGVITTVLHSGKLQTPPRLGRHRWPAPRGQHRDPPPEV
jgi:hypothetical protein